MVMRSTVVLSIVLPVVLRNILSSSEWTLYMVIISRAQFHELYFHEIGLVRPFVVE